MIIHPSLPSRGIVINEVIVMLASGRVKERDLQNNRDDFFFFFGFFHGGSPMLVSW